MENLEQKEYTTDVLIIGGGTAGCYAAYTIAKKSGAQVLIAEKANIKRSGCLAAGVNAINCYITKGHDPQFYVDYALKDAAGIARSDLLLSMCQRVNRITKDLEDHGLVILKDEAGEYVERGARNIKINGENIKPILAKMAQETNHVQVLNHVNITDLMVVDDQVCGAYGFSVNQPYAYVIHAKAVLIATGGASGLYRPNNPGFSRHKMWYSPFNTGAGYAMGIRAGAEMTSFEMRFIALRCKDTIAPTGTIAQGVSARQVNAQGDIYENKYGLTTSLRLYGTVTENKEGRGPCYLKTTGINEEQEESLLKAYLNMAPSQTLKWLENVGPAHANVEIEGTEPYIVGGHTASGFWIDEGRRTTLKGLYAAGDVAGGAPQKYVTGALSEGEIAAESIIHDLPHLPEVTEDDSKTSEYLHYFANPRSLISIENLEEAMQKIMDEYAGGISRFYQYNEASLSLAETHISALEKQLSDLHAEDQMDLLHIYELRERLIVCHCVIAHLKARKETRWHSFAENMDYPEKSDAFNLYVNSRYEDGTIHVFTRELR